MTGVCDGLLLFRDTDTGCEMEETISFSESVSQNDFVFVAGPLFILMFVPEIIHDVYLNCSK